MVPVSAVGCMRYGSAEGRATFWRYGGRKGGGRVSGGREGGFHIVLCVA